MKRAYLDSLVLILACVGCRRRYRDRVSWVSWLVRNLVRPKILLVCRRLLVQNVRRRNKES